MTTSVSVTTLLALIKRGKDLKKDLKTLSRLFWEVFMENSASWVKEIGTHLLDPLLSEVVMKLEGNSTLEKECLRLLHAICIRALLPVSLRSVVNRPFYLHEKPTEKILAGEPNAETWLKNLLDYEIVKHINGNDVFRRFYAIRTAGGLAEAGKVSNASKRKLGEVCREIVVSESMLLKISSPVHHHSQEYLRESSSSTSRLSKSFRGKPSLLNHGLNKETETNFLLLCEACISAGRKCLPESSTILAEVISVGLSASRGEISRLVMNFFLHTTLYDVDLVSKEFLPRLLPTSTIELSDVLAARDFARILFALTASPGDKSFQALALLIRDERYQVYLLASSLLSNLPWNWLAQYSLPPRNDSSSVAVKNTDRTSKLIPEMTYRLAQALKSNRSTVLLTACGVIVSLGKSRNDWISENPTERRLLDDPFFPLSGKLAALCLDCPNESIRAQAGVALAWIGKTSSNLSEKLKSIRGIEQECYLIVEALLERTRRNPNYNHQECTLNVLWYYRQNISADLAQKALLVCLLGENHDQDLNFKYILSFLDWANDFQIINWELILLNLFSTDYQFQQEYFSERKALKVFLRLERSLRFSNHLGVRREAALALVKLGVTFGEPLRIRIFETFQEFMETSLANSFERDANIRSEILVPSLKMFNEVYELFSRNETDPNLYESANKTACTLCVGVKIGFSFFNQLKEMLRKDGLPASNNFDEDHEYDSGNSNELLENF